MKSGLPSFVTRDLSEDGVVLAVATVDFKSKMILAGPDILDRVSTCEDQGIWSVANASSSSSYSYRLEEQRCQYPAVNELQLSMPSPHSYTRARNIEPIIIPMILTRWRKLIKQPVETTVSAGFILTFEDQKESGTEIGHSLEFDFVVPPPLNE